MKRPLASLILTLVLLPATAFAAPSNDNFADAETVAVPSTTVTSTADATTEGGEPQPCGLIGSTVWYTFTPGQDQAFGANTAGSDFDTVLALYTGSSLADLNLVECNDESYQGSAAYIETTLAGGVTYFYQAGGHDGAQGTLQFTMTFEGPPPEPKGAIQGTITNPEGEPVTDLCVDAYNADSFEWAGRGAPNDSGSYVIPELVADDYKVVFFHCHDPVVYRQEWYNDKSDENEADLVWVAPGQVTTGIDAVLAYLDGPPPPPPPPADPAVAGIKITNVPVGTDEHSTGVGWIRTIRVTVTNGGGEEATGVFLDVMACPATWGTCADLGSFYVDVPAGGSIQRTLRWNGLYPVPMIGDVTVTATAFFDGDPNTGNNSMSVNHYVLVKGTGFGYGG
jgi:hypothetical protein